MTTSYKIEKRPVSEVKTGLLICLRQIEKCLSAQVWYKHLKYYSMLDIFTQNYVKKLVSASYSLGAVL